MRKSALLIIIMIAIFFSACQKESISTADMDVTVDRIDNITPTVTITSTKEPSETVISKVEPTATAIVEQKEVENTSTPKITLITPNPQITPNLTATAVVTILVIEETEQSTEQPIEKPTFTPNPTVVSTPYSSTTPEPTKASECMVVSSQIRSGALEGINEAREEEGHSPASLSSSLNAKAEKHAVEMAKSNSLYHSNMGYIESVRSGAFIGGWAEGYGAANHATQLCLDADVLNIGVGCAESADGTIYTCILGSK